MVPGMTQTNTVEDLAFLYLACGHLTDRQLSPDELKEVASRVHTWRPDATLEEVGKILRSTVDAYKALATTEQKLAGVKSRALRIKDALTSEQLAKVLEDLRAVAQADGHVGANEESFVLATAKTFGLA